MGAYGAVRRAGSFEVWSRFRIALMSAHPHMSAAVIAVCVQLSLTGLMPLLSREE